MNTLRKATRALSLTVLVGIVATTLTPVTGFASTRGRRNTAIALTAGTVGAAVTHHKKTALVLGAGSVYAWKRYGDSRKHEKYRQGYRSGYSRGYRVGKNRSHYASNRGKHRGWSHSRYYRSARS